MHFDYRVKLKILTTIELQSTIIIQLEATTKRQTDRKKECAKTNERRDGESKRNKECEKDRVREG